MYNSTYKYGTLKREEKNTFISYGDKQEQNFSRPLIFFENQDFSISFSY